MTLRNTHMGRTVSPKQIKRPKCKYETSRHFRTFVDANFFFANQNLTINLSLADMSLRLISEWDLVVAAVFAAGRYRTVTLKAALPFLEHVVGEQVNGAFGH